MLEKMKNAINMYRRSRVVTNRNFWWDQMHALWIYLDDQEKIAIWKWCPTWKTQRPTESTNPLYTPPSPRTNKLHEEVQSISDPCFGHTTYKEFIARVNKIRGEKKISTE